MTPHSLSLDGAAIARAGAISSIVPITNGLSGARVYAIAAEDGDFIVRIGPDDRRAFERSLAAQRLAADAAIAPAIVYVNDTDRCVISKRIFAPPLGRALAMADDRTQILDSVGRCLNRLHGLPTSGLAPLDFGLCERTWSAQRRRSGFPDWAANLGIVLSEAADLLAEDRRRVVSHNDVTLANLLWDGERMWMIDWERAALAHPFMDLATFSSFVSMPNSEAIRLLEIQEGRTIGKPEWDVFATLRDAMSVFYGAIFVSLIGDLNSVRFATIDDTMPLAECYRAMGTGKLDPQSPQCWALLGAALLKQVTLPIK
jgi:aminoglycoside phosphotransferase (APT) family kinase protein